MTDELSPRRRALLGTVGSLGSTALSGCLSPAGGETGTLRVAQLLPPTTLDPVVLTDRWSAQVAARIFDGLYTYDDGMSIVPSIAEAKPTVGEEGCRYEVRIDAPDDRTVRFTLAHPSPVFIALAVFSLELLYFKRDAIRRGAIGLREHL